MQFNISGGQVNFAGGNGTIRVNSNSNGNVRVNIGDNTQQTYNIGGGQVNFVSGNGVVTINGQNVSGHRGKTYTAHREGKNYIVDGCDADIERNIYVKGNIYIHGVKHTIWSGKANPTVKDLFIEGDLIINGVDHNIGHIIQLGGTIINQSINSKIW